MRHPHRDTPPCSAGRSSSLPRLVLSLLLALVPVGLGAIFPRACTAQTRFRITGVVVSARDASPIPRCRLTATLAGANRGGNRQPIQVQSDERGRFALDVPSMGTWRLSATARNVHAQPYEDHNGFFTGIVLTQAQPSYNVVFRAKPDAVLSGFVIDEAGEAVRNAPVALIAVDPTASATGQSLSPRTEQATTDDRGHYEFAGLEAGSYLVNVRARPWYALQGGVYGSPASPASPSPDPSLDLVYPITWYPGTTDDASATPLVAQAGDRLEADFHLLAVPSAHLLLPLAAPTPVPLDTPRGAPGGVIGGFRNTAQVSLLLPNGEVQQTFGTSINTSSGEMDMGGLAPGTYQVRFPGANPREPGRTTIVHIDAGGTATEAGSGSSDISLTLSVDGDTTVDPSRITLIDTVSGRTITPGNRRGRPGNFNPSGGGRLPQQGRGQDSPPVPIIPQPNPQPAALSVAQPAAQSQPTPSPDGDTPGAQPTVPQRTRPRQAAPIELNLDLPPGRYEVTLPGNSGAFLTGLTATGAQTEGRFITLRDSSAHLVVHLASGLADVEGIATLHGKPCPGALVLLIPATFGAPASLATVHRDQSNTDGSFHLSEVVPGQYILLAIDHGWSVRWDDPTTLRPYLLQGSPLELAPAAAARSNLQAIAP